MAKGDLVEWRRWIDYASECAASLPARKEVQSWADPESWAPNLASATLLQSETLEVEPWSDAAFWSSFTDLPELDPVFLKLEKQAALSIEEMGRVRDWIIGFLEWAGLVEGRPELAKSPLSQCISLAPGLNRLVQAIQRVLSPRGEILSNASPRLKEIVDQTENYKRMIEKELARLMETYQHQGYLQDKVTDRRDGRYVVPVKISEQRNLDGIVYGASVSGRTVFVEPREVERLNNQVQELEIARQEEVFRILLELSLKVTEHRSAIQSWYLHAVHWDAVRARWKMAEKVQGKRIEISTDRRFDLPQSAHPLLWWSLKEEAIIFNDLEFGSPHSVYLMTGPNTGGKTVVCKSFVFAGMCARTGFFFPCATEGSRSDATPVVPYFDAFFLDLGDPQSIESSLSSFSGRVLRLKDILSRVQSRSLVFLDELNSATDPVEGAALSRAILESLMEDHGGKSGTMVLVTTHDSSLKGLAQQDERIANVSMDFDETKLVPSFRVRMGVPGRSRALETAQRLGLEIKIIEKARGYLDQRDQKLDSLLADLEVRIRAAEVSRKEAEAALADVRKMEEDWKEKVAKGVRAKVADVEERLRHVYAKAEAEARDLVRKSGGVAKESIGFNPVKATQRALSEKLEKVSSVMDEVKPRAPDRNHLHAVAVGDRILYRRWNQVGRVKELRGKKVLLQLEGGLQGTLWAELHELEAGPPEKKKPRAQVNIGFDRSGISTSLDLRGKRLEDAMNELEGYLDEAYRAGLGEVRIIHGVGTGALREGTLKKLKLTSYVASYEDDGTGMGGAGCTRVKFEGHS